MTSNGELSRPLTTDKPDDRRIIKAGCLTGSDIQFMVNATQWSVTFWTVGIQYILYQRVKR
jgi:hypothetical protein